jgi:MerR family mercuric resistance operon transcriptional regulator
MQEKFHMPDITNSRGYGIGDMSRKTGVNIETVRYYERIGIMPKPDRTEGGTRQYNHDHLKRLHFVKRSRELGFNLEEVRALLKLADRKDFTCGEVHSMTTDHLTAVKRKLSDLQRLEKVLKSMASECSQGEVPDCPIIDELFKIP